jgi:hypothetical protein
MMEKNNKEALHDLKGIIFKLVRLNTLEKLRRPFKKTLHMRIIPILCIISLLFISPASAQKTAKYAGEFISVGTGSRALGMGGAFVAVAEGSIASYWNPAGLIQLEYPEIQLMYAERFKGVVKYNYATAAMPFQDDAALGIGIMRTGVDDIPITRLLNPELRLDDIFQDENGNSVRNIAVVDHYVNDVEYVAYFSYARKWRGSRSLGANAKFIRKSVGDNSAWGIGFDIGLVTPLRDNLQLGINIQDVTTTLIAWDTGTKELITPNIKWGLAYRFLFNSLDILPAIDVDTRFEGREFASQAHFGGVSLDFHYGLEFGYRGVVFLRAGSDIGKLTAGAGIQLPTLRFDAAFLNHQDLGDTYRISAALTLNRKENQGQ